MFNLCLSCLSWIKVMEICQIEADRYNDKQNKREGKTFIQFKYGGCQRHVES